MFIRNHLNALQNYLTKAGYNHQFQKETDQVYLLQQRSGVEIATFLRILNEGELLQIVTFIPIKLRKETLNDTARLLHKINKDIDVPGFCIDESSELVFYRIVIPCLQQQCDSEILERHIKAAPTVVTTFYRLIAPVVKGEKSFEELLKEVGTPQ